MEFQRRVAGGRLSEVLGERAYDTDRLMRTLGLARLADRVVAKLDGETRSSLEAYAAGVNALVAEGRTLPPEFAVMRTGFEPWKPADTVGWLLVMAWDLSGNWRTELARLRFSAKLGPERTNQILPPYPGEPAIPLPDFKALYAEMSPTASALLAFTSGHDEAIGSNSWVLAGSRTVSGKPVLANDPHLGLQAPALWYLAHLSTPQFNVVGGTLPGVPFVVLGRNEHVGWTMTTTNGDTQDLFIERVAPGDPSSYLTPSGKAAFDVRDEFIRVGKEERRIKVRSTRHGPVISDVVRNASTALPQGHVMALAWAALSEDSATVRAGLALNRARSGAELVAAASEIGAPQQNIVYADSAGHVGMIVPARVPRRRADNEARGRVPVPGWIAKYDWQGFVPFAELPALLDPKDAHIVTANNRITPPGYKGFIASDWMPPFRAERIEALLLMTPKHSRESAARMQADHVSRIAVEALPMLDSAQPATQEGRQAKSMLADWKGDMAPDKAAPLVFAAWFREFSRLVYGDELADFFPDAWDVRGVFMIAVMRGEPAFAAWCDDVRTPAKETCGEMAGRAFDLAASDLSKRFGGPRGWRWGRAHAAASQHRPLGFTPVIGPFFNVMPETAGDTYTVNVGHFSLRDPDHPFLNRHAASLRTIHDFADLEGSLYMQSTGQSGHFLSPWYASFAERWAKVEYITIPTRREAIGAAHTLTLKPGQRGVVGSSAHDGSR
jgi:penicillin amidase